MTRRGVLAALAAVPFLRRFVKAAPASMTVPVGVPKVFEFSKTMAVARTGVGRYDVSFDSGGHRLIITAVDYQAGTITISALQPARE